MIYHVAMGINYLLQAPAEECKMMLKDRETGRELRSEEVKAHALILKAKGFEVVPSCDNYDRLGYCQGHEAKS
jgi:hypothetical protein